MGKAILLALSLVMASGAVPKKDTFKIESLAWMAGDWECPLSGGTFRETWLPPAGGTMQGVGRHLKDGKTVFMEFLSIEPTKDGGLTMYILLGAASKGPKTAAPFKLTSMTASEAVFEYPENDFPSKIAYRKKIGGGIFCRISGKQRGKEVREDYDFTWRRGLQRN